MNFAAIDGPGSACLSSPIDVIPVHGTFHSIKGRSGRVKSERISRVIRSKSRLPLRSRDCRETKRYRERSGEKAAAIT